MSRSLKYEIPGDDPRLSLADVAATGWDEIFAKTRSSTEDRPRGPRKRALVIGFGRGEFLLAMAASSPEIDFIGFELSFKRTLKMARKVDRAKLGNARLLQEVIITARPGRVGVDATLSMPLGMGDSHLRGWTRRRAFDLVLQGRLNMVIPM